MNGHTKFNLTKVIWYPEGVITRTTELEADYFTALYLTHTFLGYIADNSHGLRFGGEVSLAYERT